MMNEYTACEQAYQNGYEQGKKDAMKWHSVAETPPEGKKLLIKAMADKSICLFIVCYVRGFGFYTGLDKINKVLKWMEIPE